MDDQLTSEIERQRRLWLRYERILRAVDPSHLREWLCEWIESTDRDLLERHGFAFTASGQGQCREPPLEPAQAWNLLFTIRMRVLFTVALQVLEEAGPDEALQALCLAPMAVGCLIDLGHPDLTTFAAATLAGWVGSRTSIKRNRRLETALLADGPDPARALLVRLPGPVLIAWSEREPGGFLKQFVREVLHELEADCPRGPLRHELRPKCPEPPAIESFQAREEVETFCRKAGLSGRESEAIRLYLEGLGNRGIAQEMGIEPGTVSCHLDRARKKIQNRVTPPGSLSA
jgi:RNA polymerase sigma factor (sigma-70 family)